MGWTVRREVTACAFSPDGRQLLAGLGDGSLMVLNGATGEYIRTLSRYWHGGRRQLRAVSRTPVREPGETVAVNACSFSPDGSRVVAGFADGAVKIVDASTGTQVVRGIGIAFSALDCAFAANGQLVAAGGGQQFRPGDLRFFGVVPGSAAPALTSHSDRITALSFSPNGLLLASCSDDLTLKFWNVAQRIETYSFPLTSAARSMCWHPDGRRLALGTTSGQLQLFRLEQFPGVDS